MRRRELLIRTPCHVGRPVWSMHERRWSVRRYNPSTVNGFNGSGVRKLTVFIVADVEIQAVITLFTTLINAGGRVTTWDYIGSGLFVCCVVTGAIGNKHINRSHPNRSNSRT